MTLLAVFGARAVLAVRGVAVHIGLRRRMVRGPVLLVGVIVVISSVFSACAADRTIDLEVTLVNESKEPVEGLAVIDTAGASVVLPGTAPGAGEAAVLRSDAQFTENRLGLQDGDGRSYYLMYFENSLVGELTIVVTGRDSSGILKGRYRTRTGPLGTKDVYDMPGWQSLQADDS